MTAQLRIDVFLPSGASSRRRDPTGLRVAIFPRTASAHRTQHCCVLHLSVPQLERHCSSHLTTHPPGYMYVTSLPYVTSPPRGSPTRRRSPPAGCLDEPTSVQIVLQYASTGYWSSEQNEYRPPCAARRRPAGRARALDLASSCTSYSTYQDRRARARSPPSSRTGESGQQLQARKAPSPLYLNDGGGGLPVQVNLVSPERLVCWFACGSCSRRGLRSRRPKNRFPRPAPALATAWPASRCAPSLWPSSTTRSQRMPPMACCTISGARVRR